MSCNCPSCGRPKDCGEPFCDICLIDFEKNGDTIKKEGDYGLPLS